MEKIVIFIYILGIFVTHYIIYKKGEESIDHVSANIACVAWPATLVLFGLLWIEDWLNSIFQK